MITFLPNFLPSDNKKLPQVSNSILYPENLIFFKIRILVSLTAPNEKLSNAKSLPAVNGCK